MEFLVYTENRLSPDTDPERVAELRAAERVRADELRAAGVLKRLWRTPGRWATVALYEAPDATDLHDALASLPMWRFTDVRVEPLASHPQER
ncbi:muconolactone Delta-isomerase [Conexibacter sp. CPCC 206217]|uniref:muconolactone Delta-isomerase n=1 Tax=Conexibacter sp. CPCC 206217 TaxID=3064574 RepID=UPI0027170618|nr:muconolactone Delta-isomerase family protein [Conexibacter sp. CPCC 206217]MDO8213157.1 muconolactone Delta-isomerase family protein [Conexibacter sp. CPCC 206217]